MSSKKTILYIYLAVFFCSVSSIHGMMVPVSKASVSNPDHLTKLLFDVLKGTIDSPPAIISLVKQGANINAQNAEHGHTPLFVAARHGHIKSVNALLGLKADPHVRSKKNFIALHLACEEMNFDIMKVLIDAGSDVNAISDDGVTPLQFLANNGYCKGAVLLLKHKADVNTPNSLGLTPLHIACRGKHVDLVELFVAHKAHVNALASTNVQPLHMASQSGALKIMSILLKHKAELERSTTKEGATPLLAACQVGNVSAMRELMSKGANPYAETSRGCNALGLACLQGNVKAVEFLLSQKVDVNRLMGAGFLPIHITCKTDNVEILKILIKNKVDITALCRGLTPLEIAQDYGNEEVSAHLKRCIESENAQRKFLEELEKEESSKKIVKPNGKNSTKKNKLSPKKVLSVQLDIKKKKKTGSASTASSDDQSGTLSPRVIEVSAESVKTVPINVAKQNLITPHSDSFMSIHDDERSALGGYTNEIFVFNSKNTGTYSQKVDKQGQFVLVPVAKDLDNVGSQLVDNHVLNLKYSKHVLAKMENLRDIFHNFTVDVEKKCGHLGCAIIKDSQIDAQRKAYLTKEFNISENISDYWYEVTVTIPAQVRPEGFPEDMAKAQGPSGVFNS